MPGRLTIGSQNLKIGDHWLRIGPLGGYGPGEWDVISSGRAKFINTFGEDPGSPFFFGSPALGAGFYVVIMVNLTLDSVAGTGVTRVFLESFNASLGGGWPLFETNCYRVIVAEGGSWTGGTYTKLGGEPPLGTGAIHVIRIVITGNNPSPFLPVRILEPETPPGGSQQFSAQDSDGNWVPDVNEAIPYEVDETIFA